MNNESIITIYTDDGDPVDVEFLDLIQLKIDEEEREFIVVAPLGDDEVAILEMETYGDDVVFVSIDDEDIHLAVWKAFVKRNSDKYDFEDVDALL